MSVESSSFTATITSPGAAAALPPKSNIQAALAKLEGKETPAAPPAVSQPNVTQAPVVDPKAAVVTPEQPGDTKPEDATQPKEPEKKEDPLSQRFAMLARREQGIVKAQQDLKAKEAELAKREETLGSAGSLESQRKKEVAENPLKALEYYGVTYEQLTNFILQGEKATPEMTASKIVDEKFEAFKKQQEEEKAAAAAKEREDLEKQHQETLEQFRTDVQDFVKSHSEEYELINLYNQAPLVISTIEQHFEATSKDGKPGKILSFKEAADLVEKYLEDEAMKAMATKRLSAKGAPQPKVDPAKAGEAETPAQQRTLTNTMSSSAPSLLSPKTEQERMERALAALTR